MAKTVIGVFRDRRKAEQAVQELRGQGFGDQEISIVAKDPGQAGRKTGGTQNDISDGTAWGAGIGGTAGLLASAGALAVPGIGPLLAMGPLAATLGGAAAGGLAGGLVDYGIPEQEGKKYEQRVKQGDVLVVLSSTKNVDKAAQILRQHGAEDVMTR